MRPPLRSLGKTEDLGHALREPAAASALDSLRETRPRHEHVVATRADGAAEVVEGEAKPSLQAVAGNRPAHLAGNRETEARLVLKEVLFPLAWKRVEDEVARRDRPPPAIDGVEVPRAGEAVPTLHRGLRRIGAFGPWRGGASGSRGRPASACAREIRAAACVGARSAGRFASRVSDGLWAVPAAALRRQSRGDVPAPRRAVGPAGGPVPEDTNCAVRNPQPRSGSPCAIGEDVHIVEMPVDNHKCPAIRRFFPALFSPGAAPVRLAGTLL